VSDHPSTVRYGEGPTEVKTTPLSEGPAATEADPTPRPSHPAGRYVPGAEIARGGMGRVVVGTDTRLGREVAIKEALPQGGDLDRFEREVRITARLEHPSIVPLYDAGVAPSGRPFYVMRKVSGQPLERLVAERTPPDAVRPRDRAALDHRLALLPHVLAAAHALGHAHRRGVIHRDVKPANILVGEHGETVVIDWGLAKVIGEDEALAAPPIDRAIAPSGEIATQTGAVFGTPSFMAPEQARAEPLDARSDVYSLGATLFHVVTGHPPLPGPLTEVLAGARDPRRAAAALVELAALPLPPELGAIVDKAMQFEPARRYPDAAALADDLGRFLAGRLVAAHRYTVGERLRRYVRRHRGLVAVTAVSALVLAVGGALALRGIVVERGRAQHAEQAALAGQRAAEAARERETDRADDAVILKARSELERDPTSAIATLAALAPGSRRWPQARPIAIEARLRGIAQVYRAEFAPRTLELAPDPRSLLIAGSTPGVVSIIDLVHNRARTIAACPGRCAAAWGDRGAAVWIAPADGGLYAVDTATGARRPAVLDGAPEAAAEAAVEQLRADSAATVAGFALRDGRAGWLDAGGVHYLPGATGKIEHVQVAPDGAWLAFASRRELVVIDRGGRELARETGELSAASLAHAGSGNQLAILAGRDGLLEIDVAGGRATPRRVPLPWRVFWLTYVGDTAYVNLRSATEMRPLHDLDSRSAEFPHVWGSRPTWQGHTAVASDALQLIGPTRHVLAPPIHAQFLTLAARGDARYLAAYTGGAVMTWDLGDALPQPIADHVIRTWIYDDELAVVSDIRTCEWLDLKTLARTPIATPRGAVTWDRPDPAHHRQLLFIEPPGEPPGEPPIAVIARPGRSEVEPIAVPGLRRVDLVGADIIAGTSGGDVVQIGDRGPRVIHHFDSPVDMVVGNGGWIAAQARSGALARIDAATGAVDTALPAFEVSYTLVTRRGELYLAAGRDLMHWRGGGFDRIATLPVPIATVDDIQGRDALVVTTDQRAVYIVELAAAEPDRVNRLFFRTADLPQIDAAGRYMAVASLTGEVTVLDLSRGTRWRLPWHEPVSTISPTGRVALLFYAGRVSAAHLDAPDDPAALRAWVVHATNFTPDATGP